MSTKAQLALETPDSVLQKLLQGNVRFRDHEHTHRDFMQEIKETEGDQYPFAIILGCMDSRVPVEILFDQGIGDLFINRVAGNVENSDIIGGMEYACEVIGTKLIMVLGHENCGAVKAACDDVQLGHITEIVQKIKPSIKLVGLSVENTSKNDEYVDQIAKVNVLQTIESIRQKSEVLRELELGGKIKIVGAFYRLQSGMVDLI